MNLVYPRCTKVDLLEYEWEGRSAVVVFSCGDDLATVKAWYRKIQLSIKVIEDTEEWDTAQYHFYTDDTCRTKVAEVCLAGPESFDDLSSYMGSESLDEMIQHEPLTIGALFMCKHSTPLHIVDTKP
jgi:hypothetical protein